MKKRIPHIEDIAGINAHSGEVVQLIGQYLQNDVRMRKENPAVLHDGHAAILLSDKTLVYLFPPWHELARREKREVEEMENKIVCVECTVLPYIPQGSYKQQICLELVPCIVKLIALSKY